MLDLSLSAAAKNKDADIKDTDASRFEKDVLHVSMTRPVIVDFWAPWCGPCKQMMPALEKAVGDTKGAVALVKVNIDNNPELAQAFRVQSVPMVYAFFQGQPVDGFMGAKPPSEISAFIEKLKKLSGVNENMPAEADRETRAKLMAQATASFSKDDIEGAMTAYSQVLETDPENLEALSGIGWCFVAQKDTESLKAMMEDIPAAQQSHPRIKGLKFIIDKGVEGGDKSVTAPKTNDERYTFALHKMAALDIGDAIDALVDLTKKDREWQEQNARKLMLEIFEALGPTHPLTRDGRRKLSAVLFS